MARVQLELEPEPTSLTEEQLARLPVALREVLLGGADWMTLISTLLPRRVINAAATRLGHDLSFLSCRFKAPPIDRRVREAYRAVGRAVVHAYLRTHVFPEALVLAADRAHRRQRIRISRDWAKTARGHVASAVPYKGLTLSLMKAWLRQEAKRIAADLIRDGALDPLLATRTRRPGRPDTPAHESTWAQDLLPLLDAPNVRAGLDALPVTHWRHLRARLSPRERQLAELLRRGASRAEAADTLRVHASTVKSLYGRILKKARLLG